MAAAGTVVTVGSIETSVLETRLKSAPKKNLDRQAAIYGMFQEAGCDAANLEQRPLGHSKNANVVCTVPLTGEGTIVVGAHFDHVSAGDGIVDNWSGATLLPALISSLKAQGRKHTFVYAAFAEEETGLNGSGRFANGLSKADRATVGAMVNVDSVGLGPTAVWYSRADKELSRYAFLTAQSLKLSLDVGNVDGAGDTDSASFQRLKIPVIDFHSFHRETFSILHSAKDTFKAISLSDYADTFRLISTYLGMLDQTLR